MAREYMPIKKTRDDLTGCVFGLLTVQYLLGSYKNKHYWMCSCTCGGSSEVPGSSLRSGNTKSCGCVATAKTAARNTTHGGSKTPLYGAWRRMIQRCEDEGCDDYKYYGARGIAVCERWHDFALFLDDVGPRPEGGTIERVRNNEDYGPTNFRWATRHEQMQNTRQTRLITHDGKTMSLSEWARVHDIKPRTLNARVNVLGYSFEAAISKEVKCGIMLNGKSWKENRKGNNDANCTNAA